MAVAMNALMNAITSAKATALSAPHGNAVMPWPHKVTAHKQLQWTSQTTPWVSAHREVRDVVKADANVGMVAASVVRAAARVVANAARPMRPAQRVKMVFVQPMLATTWPPKTAKPLRELTRHLSAASVARATDTDAIGVNVRLNNVQTQTRARRHL
jgi:hypothetical protein